MRVRNIIGSYELPWEVVRGIRFDRGAPWAALELYDDDLLPVVALQAADKQHAVDGVRALRRLHQAHLAVLAERTPAPDLPAARRRTASAPLVRATAQATRWVGLRPR